MSCNYINFTYRKNTGGFLLNKSSYPVVINNNGKHLHFSTGEHAFHYIKFMTVASHPDIDYFRSCLFRSIAEKILVNNILTNEDINIIFDIDEEMTWKQEYDKVQYQICLYKYNNYPEIKKYVDDTGDCLLINISTLHEHLLRRDHWRGRVIGDMIVGGNTLGYMWMSIRDMNKNTILQ